MRDGGTEIIYGKTVKYYIRLGLFRVFLVVQLPFIT